ncbi:MAG: beta-lactamase family protein [Bacteroidales bacterium]|nr:beta-lactamase family protein [Bacteroidales bacterium]
MKRLFLLLMLASMAMASSCNCCNCKKKTALLDLEKMQAADSVLNEAIAQGKMPGAVLAVVVDGETAYMKAYGNRSVFPDTVPMTVETVFDMASCSKCVGTTMSMMHLMEHGGFRLGDNVDMYIPGFRNWVDPETGEETPITIYDLLTHASGLPSYVSPDTVIAKCGVDDPDSLMSYIAQMPRLYKPKQDFTYSCLNFITLQNILQKITGKKLCDYATENIFKPLEMTHTCYNPAANNNEEVMALVAPTEKKDSTSCFVGEVHDPLARVLNHGNSGNAGVFSCAEDLCKIAKCLMNEGNYNGKQIIGKITFQKMITVPTGYEHLGRALGWDKQSGYSWNKGNLFTEDATICHTGYTGTSFVLDTKNKVAVILLTNRVHPYDKGGLGRITALVSNIAAASVL